MSDWVIEANDIRFAYGVHEVLHGVTFAVRSGEILGLLGPNGAGKTTLLHVLAAIQEPSCGEVMILGHHAHREADTVRAQMCLIQQERAVDFLLNVQRNLIFYALLQDIPRRSLRVTVERVAGALGLTGHLAKTVFQLSGGLIRRLQFAPALISSSPILLLDEPTLGIDPDGKYSIWATIRAQARENGRTVIVATNDMSEADALCDRVLLLKNGEVAALESPQNLKALVAGAVLRVTTISMLDSDAPILELSRIAGVVDVSNVEGVLMVTLSRLDSNVGQVLSVLNALDIGIDRLEVRTPTLDEAFMTLLAGGRYK